MTAAGIVYPVTDAALHHTSPIMIATLRALVGGALLTALLALMGSRLPRTRRLWRWAFAIGFGNTTLTQVGISVGTQRAGGCGRRSTREFSPVLRRLDRAVCPGANRSRGCGLRGS